MKFFSQSILVICILAGGFILPAKAQNLASDSADIHPRTTNQHTLDSLTAGEAYTYQQQPKNPESLGARILQWFLQVLDYIGDNPWASSVIKILFYAIFALMILGLLSYFIEGDVSSLITGRASNGTVPSVIIPPDAEPADYNAMLKEAIADQNYPVAVRLLYLQGLQKLSEHELIRAKADKTNEQYARELDGHPARDAFLHLAHYHDYVEYGDFKVDRQGFEQAQKYAHQLLENIDDRV